MIIRKVIGDRCENHHEIATGEWKLREQVEALEQWLKEGPRLDPREEWIADIGFCPRADATGGGPPITLDFMKLCIANNLEMYLSEYGSEEAS